MWNFKQYAGQQAAITEYGDAISYQQLKHAGVSLVENITNRCLVFSLCTNSIGALVGYSGLINHKHVPLLLDASLDLESLKKLIDIYRPDFLWMPTGMASQFDGFHAIYEAWDYILLKAPFDWEYPLSDDLALLLTTSGSTGSPKLVRLSYKNLEANTRSIVDYLQLDQSERPITTLPMNYSYGLSIINSHLAVGATLLMTSSSLMEKSFWSFFKDQKATSFGGVPYTYEILNKLRFYRMELDSLRIMTQAGGRLSPELHQKFAEYAQTTGKRFYVMYGQTEATARMAYLPHEKSLEKCGSIGVAIPGGSFSLIDADGKEIQEPHIAGELVYSGQNVSLGYAESGEDLIRGDELQSRLFTGDIAKFDADNYFYIVGRKKRFLKIFGNRVNLDETEQMIKSNFQNIECACTGVDDKMYVFYVGDFFAEEIKKFVSEKTKLNMAAFQVADIDTIPKSESGKISYPALELIVTDGKFAGVPHA
jgi:acyl-coenzyme A synthetase/AMP-(fatty) acid ligase